jgi:hypothetical protein
MPEIRCFFPLDLGAPDGKMSGAGRMRSGVSGTAAALGRLTKETLWQTVRRRWMRIIF